MKFRKRFSIEKGALDLAPLINVIFLLLIFFMITSSFIFQPGISVNLPKAITSDVIHKENLNIIVTYGNDIFIDDRRVNDEELVSRLKVAASQDRPILIKSDRKSSFGEVVRIWDLARGEGVKKINIATSQEGK